MASLGRDFNISQGARFFNDSSNMEDDRQFSEPILAESDNFFKEIKTGPIFSFHLFVSLIISLTGITLAIIWKDEKRCDAYFIMLYLRVIFWILTFVFHHIIIYHHEKLRMNGYHEFHKEMSIHKTIPLYLVSLWNTAILLVQALLQHYYGTDFQAHCLDAILSPIVYISMFSGTESIILLVVYSSYIGKILKFNKNKPLPDALSGSYTIGGSLGVTQRGADVAELLEKQADLINYLKDHNLKLNHILMQLNSQVRTVTLPQ